jgi:hypothetical protein
MAKNSSLLAQRRPRGVPGARHPIEVTHPMQPQPDAIRAHETPLDGLIRTRYTLLVYEVCGHERIDTHGQQTICPECGASARRSFALFRDLREER